MAGSSTYSWWQWARWTWNIARNMRITNPTGAELAAVRTFLKYIYNPITQTGTRPWLKDNYQEKAVNPGDDYACNLDNEPAWVLVEILNVVGRDLKKIPITDSEVVRVSVLIVATGNRRYGTGALFGGVAGSNVTVP
jgi:hypothetical protein